MFRQRIQNSKVFLSIWILTCLSKKQKVANALSAKTTANLHQNPLFLCRRMDVMLFTRKDQEEKKIENHDVCKREYANITFRAFASNPNQQFINLSTTLLRSCNREDQNSSLVHFFSEGTYLVLSRAHNRYNVFLLQQRESFKSRRLKAEYKDVVSVGIKLLLLR